MNTNEMQWQFLREHIVHKHLAGNEEKNIRMDIIKLPANFEFNEHIHPEEEWVYILKGAFTDERGTHRQGDFIVNEKNSKHKVSTGNEECEILCCWCGVVKEV